MSVLRLVESKAGFLLLTEIIWNKLKLQNPKTDRGADQSTLNPRRPKLARRGSSHVASTYSEIEDVELKTRYHYMDNLRALAMLAGVVFHAALAYSPLLANVWPPASSDNALIIDVVAWFSHLFRMPLFFLIAGFFACYLFEKRGLGGFLKNRILRIALPFVIFLPLILAGFAFGIQWALGSVENPSPILAFMKMGAAMPDPPPPPAPTTTHLWFLYYLIQFCLVYAVLERLGLMRSRLTELFGSVPFLLLALPLLVASSLVGYDAPRPAPEQFMPQFWPYGFYGLFFLVGIQFFRDQSLTDRLMRWMPVLIVVSLGAYAALFSQLPDTLYLMQAMNRMQGAEFSLEQCVMSLLQGVVAVYMTLACLVIGRLLLDRANSLVRFVADGSYWLYIIHLPLLFYIQYRLLDVDRGLWVEFGVATLSTMAIGLVSYAILVRHTPIGWLLNGRKRRADKLTSHSTAGPQA